MERTRKSSSDLLREICKERSCNNQPIVLYSVVVRDTVKLEEKIAKLITKKFQRSRTVELVISSQSISFILYQSVFVVLISGL